MRFYKCATLLLTLGLVLQCGIFAAPPDSPQDMGEKLELVSKLGILQSRSDGSVSPDTLATRMELAWAAAVLVNGDVSLVTDEKSATDLVSSFGIMTGGNWESPTTAMQILKVMVCVLGYGDEAERGGGYPSGYIAFASQLGLATSVDFSAQATRGTLGMMIYNTLESKPLERTTYGGKDEELNVSKRTLLETRFSIAKTNAILTAAGKSALLPDFELPNDKIMADGTQYKVDDAEDFVKYLGFAVTVYWQYVDGMPKAKIVIARNSRNSLLEIPSENIDKAVRKPDGSIEIEYHNDSKTYKATVFADAWEVYNGRGAPLSELDMQFTDSIGQITLISNNSSDYNTVIIKSYENIVVDYVSSITNGFEVFDKYDSTKSVVLDEDKTLIIRSFGRGNTRQISDIKPWDVLTIARSKDGRNAHTEITISNEGVSGTIEEKTSIPKHQVRIGGQWYRAEEYIYDSLELGEYGVFLVTPFNHICGIDEDSPASSTYGYLTRVGDKNGLGEPPEMRILAADGNWNTYTVANRVVLNGTLIDSRKRSNNSDDLLFCLQELKGSIPQLVKFKLDNSGYINELTIDNGTGDEGTLKLGDNSLVNGEYLLFSGIVNAFIYSTDQKINIGPQTIVFTVSDDLDAEETFAVRKFNYFVNDRRYTVAGYEDREMMTSEVVVEYTSTADTPSGDAAYVTIDRITEISVEGRRLQKVYGVSGGRRVEYIAAKQGVFDGVTPGDIVRLRFNSMDNVQSCETAFEFDTQNGIPDNTTPQTGYTILRGYVGQVSTKLNKILVNTGTPQLLDTSWAGITVAVFDTETKRASVASVSDIKTSDFVVIRKWNSRFSEAVIIR